MFLQLPTLRTRGGRIRVLSVWLAMFVRGALNGPANADTFIVREDDGKQAKVDARLAGEGQGCVALEKPDGRIEIVPQDQILKRIPGPDPDPITREEMLQRLTERFGKEKFRGYAEQNYVIGMVLAESLPKKLDKTATELLKKGAKFMRLVDKEFLKFVDDLKVDLVKPRYPLVVLIFETDDDFIAYTEAETGGRGLTAGNMLGYYSGLSNHLVIRMSECHTFETPLHEAIHQQVYNRGVLQRLSAAPAWFNEGIATGFEGNGERINAGPLTVNLRYARPAINAKIVDWDDVVADDKAFRGDVLAGEAYAHAWSIHWFLVTKYRKQYMKYLQLLSQKKPLEKDDDKTRIKEFEEIFGKSVGKLQAEFPEALRQAALKMDLKPTPRKPPGYLLAQSNLAEVELNVANTENSGPAAEGRMRNMSLLRPMSFLVTVETNAGTYAEWYLPNVAPRHAPINMDRELITKRMVNGPGGPSSSFGVRVRAVVADSPTDQQWKRGNMPVPTFRGD